MASPDRSEPSRGSRCPECNGTLRPTLVGTAKDKHLECEYCGKLVDVEDSSTTIEEEVESFIDPSGRRVQRTRRTIHSRSDGNEPRAIPAGRPTRFLFESPDSQSFIDLSDREAAREQLRAQLGDSMADSAIDSLLEQIEEQIQSGPSAFEREVVYELESEPIVEIDGATTLLRPRGEAPWDWAPPPTSRPRREPAPAPTPLALEEPPEGLSTATLKLLLAGAVGVIGTLLLVLLLG